MEHAAGIVRCFEGTQHQQAVDNSGGCPACVQIRLSSRLSAGACHYFCF
jgi:hypothetical protein